MSAGGTQFIASVSMYVFVWSSMFHVFLCSVVTPFALPVFGDRPHLVGLLSSICVDSGGSRSCATERFRCSRGSVPGRRYGNVRLGARSTRAALGAWRATGLRSVNTERAEARGHGEWFLRWAYALFHPHFVHWGRVFFTTEHTETPFGRHGRGRETSVLRVIQPRFSNVKM